MWFYYLLSAIGVSVGTGALVAYDSEQQIAAVIKASEPETHAENTVRISRALRRLHQMNPSAFPSASGSSTAKIPDHLLEAATVGGLHIPHDIEFRIDSQGHIVTEVSTESAMNTDRYKSVVEEGSLYPEDRMNLIDRDISSIRNPDPYDFYATPNIEGVDVGANVGWRNGGIINPQTPGNSNFYVLRAVSDASGYIRKSTLSNSVKAYHETQDAGNLSGKPRLTSIKRYNRTDDTLNRRLSDKLKTNQYDK